MSKVSKIFHIRAPLVIKNIIGRREVTPTVVPDRAANNGGATIIVEGDTDNPGFVQVRVALCRFSDNYSKKVGIKTAKAKDPMVVPLRLLARELSAQERHMLLATTPSLRRDEELLRECMQGWSYVTSFFLPGKKEEEPAAVDVPVVEGVMQ